MEDNRQQRENSPINLQIFSQAEQGMISLSAEAQIYKDPKSPFFTAPKNVKEFLLKNKTSDNSLNLNEINLDEIYFEPMPTENHLCMKYFGRDEDKYYHCYECTGESWAVDRVVFCEACFVVENHIGHHYYMQRARRRDQYCDCGSQNKTTVAMVCPKHNQKKKVSIQIREDHRQYFINTFTSLIEVACYLDNSDLIEKVCEKLSTLCEYSGFYSKLSLQFLMKESIDYKDNSQSKYFMTILAEFCDVNRILFQICGNDEQNMELAKFMTKNYDRIRPHSNRYSNIDDNIYKVICDFKTMDKLAHQGYFAKQTYFIYQEFAEVDKQHVKFLRQQRNLYLRFIKYLFKTQPKMKVQKFFKFGIKDKDITNSQISWQFLKQIISIYPYKKKNRVITYKSHSENNQNKKNAPKKGRKPNENLFKQQQISYYMKCIHMMVMRCVAIITQGNWQKILNFRQNFIENGVCLKSFQYILLEIAYFADSFIFNNQSYETPAFATALLVGLFKKSERASVLLSHMWLALVGTHQNIEMATANVFQAISNMLFFKKHLSIFQGVIKKIKKDQFQEKYDESREEQMKKFFIKFLQLRGIIERQQLIDIKNANLLQFQDLGKTLRSSCTYNEDDEAFICNMAATEDEFEDKFALTLRQTNVQTMSSNMYANTNIFYGFEQNLILDQDVAQVLQFICNSQILLNLLDDIFKLKQKSQNEDVKYGYLYLFTLVMINGFTNGSIKQLKQRLSNFKTVETLKKYSQNKTQFELLQRLFCIEKKQKKLQNIQKGPCNGNLMMDEKESKENKNSQQENIQIQRKRKFEEKRKKISEKYQKKQQLVLESIRSKTIDGSLFSDEDICLTCHEKNHQHNQLVYLGRISVDSSLSQAMHGSEQKANTSIFTCFHTVHLNCFIDLHKNNRMRAYMSCPLCNQSVNCFLMRSFNYENRQLNNIFNNILISNLVVNYKCYNTSNYFILFFKHLLQSKGLGCLVDSAENWQRDKVTDKNDYFIQNLMTKIYDDSNKVQKQAFMSEIQRLIQDIKSCSKESCKSVQLAIAESLKEKILSGSNAEIDVELLKNVRKVIKYEEYLIIKQQVEKILKQKIEVPQIEDEPQEQKKQSLSFSLKELPRDSSKFKQFLKDKVCSKNHTAKMDFYCLICGEAVCEECNDTNSFLQHGGISAYLSINDFILHLKNPAIDEERDIYFNDFRISYNEREDNDMEDDVYILDVIKLSAFVQQFLRQ